MALSLKLSKNHLKRHCYNQHHFSNLTQNEWVWEQLEDTAVLPDWMRFRLLVPRLTSHDASTALISVERMTS